MSIARPDDSPAVASAPPMDSEIREQLARIRSSSGFDAPDRAQKFLTYVIEETLQGRADRIKAYSIAIEVFGRDASFDAQNDPVVRIEAGRVRRALEHYYLLVGQKDPILITIPKGGYVPAFTRFADLAQRPMREQPEKPDAPSSRKKLLASVALSFAAVLFFGAGVWNIANRLPIQAFSGGARPQMVASAPEMPRVVVTAFEDLTGTPTSTLLASGLSDEVIGQMARFKEITVLTREPATGTKDASTAVSDLPFYRLEGRVRLDDDRLRFSARLVDQDDGAIIWTKAYDAELGKRKQLDIETQIAGEVARSLAQPYGIIFQENASAVLNKPSVDAWAYACSLSYYGYRTDLNKQTHVAVQTCLKQVVKHFPNYATGWALLSLTYLDELRFRYRLGSSETPPLDRVVEAAERAVELDPGNVRALQAKMLADFFRGNVGDALAIGERALTLNPNDTELVGEYGFRLALSGKWDQGCNLVADTVEFNPGPMGYFQTALAVCAYMKRDYKRAESWARASNMQDNPIYHMILAAIFGQQGNQLQAQLERGWLELNAPEYLVNARAEVAARILRTEDQQHFIDGLRKAGLDVSVQRTLRSERSSSANGSTRG